MTTGKTRALTRWTFVGKLMSLLLNMLSRLVITFLPRSKRLLISWLQSAMILEPPKIKSATVSTVSPSISHEVMQPDAMILVFWMLSFDAIQLSHPHHPLLLLPPVYPSIRICSSQSVLHIRWPEYWGFSFSNSSSNEYLGLISFKIDWFDLLSVQGILKSLLQHHSSKTSILQCSGLYGPTLTSMHVYWKKHNFYYADIFQQSDFRI